MPKQFFLFRVVNRLSVIHTTRHERHESRNTLDYPSQDGCSFEEGRKRWGGKSRKTSDDEIYLYGKSRSRIVYNPLSVNAISSIPSKLSNTGERDSSFRRKTNHETSNRLNSVSRLNKIFARRCTTGGGRGEGGAIELPCPLRPILSSVSFFFFFFTAWKSEGRANNNGEKSWTRSRDNKNLDDKDFFSLFAWRDGISLSPDEKKKKEKRTLRKFPIDNKFINERIDITILMANKSSDGYLFSFSRGIIRS